MRECLVAQIILRCDWFCARTQWANVCLFCEKISHHFRRTSVHSDFFSHLILSSLLKLQMRRRPASEQDKFLLGVSIIHILQPKESIFKCSHS